MRQAEINETDNRKTKKKINETKVGSLRIIVKQVKLQVDSSRKNKIHKLPISEMRGDITKDSADIINHYQYCFANKLDNLNKVEKLLQRYKLPKLTQEIN